MSPDRMRALLFTCEPGGAEVIAPLAALLQGNGIDVVLAGYGHAGVRFHQKNMEYLEVSPIVAGDMHLVDSSRPDVIITSATSLPEFDMSEKYLWENAREKGIPTVAFIDQWQNYALRFSGKNADEALKYQPDFINCINDIGCREAMDDGLPQEKLCEFGHPYLAELMSRYEQVSVSDIRKQLGIDDGKKVALFVSEAIREHFGAVRGYDQYETLALFLQHMAQKHEDIAIVLKLHPKDSVDKFRETIDAFRQLSPIVVHSELTSLDCLAVSDVVFGMTSIMLIEAYLLGKPVLSIQPGLAVADPLVLSRHELVPLVRETLMAGSLMDVAVDSRKNKQTAFDVAFKADDFILFVDQLAKNRRRSRAAN